MIKAIFFDNDGVLVSTEHLYLAANQAMLAEQDLTLSAEDYKKHFLKSSGGLYAFLKNSGFPAQKIETLKARRNQIYVQKVSTNSVVIPGVLEVIKNLSNRYPLFIVTSSHRDPFECMHQNSNLLPYFQTSFCREDYRHSKPAPDGYAKALAQAQISSAEALVIEDAPRGIAAAQCLGIQTIAIPHVLTLDMDFSQADHILENITQLPDLINQLNAPQ